MNWQSSRAYPPAIRRATSQAKATFEASGLAENMLSPKKAARRLTP